MDVAYKGLTALNACHSRARNTAPSTPLPGCCNQLLLLLLLLLLLYIYIYIYIYIYVCVCVCVYKQFYTVIILPRVTAFEEL